MRNITEMPSTQDDCLMELRYLRVAAYCRVSTDVDAQISSLELQERHYTQIILGNSNSENTGIFSERAIGLNLKECYAFHKMISKFRKGEIDMVLIKFASRFTQNTFCFHEIM